MIVPIVNGHGRKPTQTARAAPGIIAGPTSQTTMKIFRINRSSPCQLDGDCQGKENNKISDFPVFSSSSHSVVSRRVESFPHCGHGSKVRPFILLIGSR